MNETRKIARQADKITYKFASGHDAWVFVRACDDAGHVAGFPGLREPTVRVLVRTWMEREALDALAGPGVEVAGYEFADSASEHDIRRIRAVCRCGDGPPGDWEGPLRDCPDHGEKCAVTEHDTIPCPPPTGALAGNCDACGCDHTHAPTGWHRLDIDNAFSSPFDSSDSFYLLCDACLNECIQMIKDIRRLVKQ